MPRSTEVSVSPEKADAVMRRVEGMDGAVGQIAMGIVVGCALAGLMDHALDGGWTGGRGLLALVTVAALMTAVGFLAALGPARRALRISPTEALKSE